MDIREIISAVRPADPAAKAAAKRHWDGLAKPLGSLGVLENDITKIAALTGSADVRLDRRALLVFCADNGVVARGISQSDHTVTAAVARALGRGESTVSYMAEAAGCEITAVDIGMCADTPPGVIGRKIRRGTEDILPGPAMTREECEAAVLAGVELAGRLAGSKKNHPRKDLTGKGSELRSGKRSEVQSGVQPGEGSGVLPEVQTAERPELRQREEPEIQSREAPEVQTVKGSELRQREDPEIQLREASETPGADILLLGEMGIGNTTTAAAAACALLGREPEELAGRGAGLSDDGLRRKIEVIRRALEVSRPDPGDPLDILQKVGGLDLAALCGVCLGGALFGIPVLLDGMITDVAALCAVRLCPAAEKALIASHVSREPAAALLLEVLGLEPCISAGLHLGEGSGAVMALGLLDMALTVYHSGHTFGALGIGAYTPQ